MRKESVANVEVQHNLFAVGNAIVISSAANTLRWAFFFGDNNEGESDLALVTTIRC
jgi:hypothetical protein